MITDCQRVDSLLLEFVDSFANQTVQNLSCVCGWKRIKKERNNTNSEWFLVKLFQCYDYW